MRSAGGFIAAIVTAATVLVAMLYTSPASARIDYPDILGAWCSDRSKYTFTRKTFAIFVFNSKGEGTFKIVRYKFSDNEVDVGWHNPQAGERHAAFGEFSKDGRMFQLARDEAPRKEFKRC